MDTEVDMAVDTVALVSAVATLVMMTMTFTVDIPLATEVTVPADMVDTDVESEVTENIQESERNMAVMEA